MNLRYNCIFMFCRYGKGFWLENVLNITEKRNLLISIINIIKEIYTKNETLIKTESSVSREIPVKQGIWQGDSLSQNLFTLVMVLISKIN
jgi:hypothetical protein